VSTGERSKAYNILFAFYLLASVVGPAVTILLFESHGGAGRSWELGPLRNIVFAGLGFEIATMLCLLMLRDKWQLGEESETEGGAGRGSTAGDTGGGRGSAAREEGSTDGVGSRAADPEAGCGVSGGTSAILSAR
jgi:MFS family permease